MAYVYARVRVEDPSTGHQYNANQIHAKTARLKVLDKPVADVLGRPHPAQMRTDLAGRPAPRQSAEESTEATTTEKENA